MSYEFWKRVKEKIYEINAEVIHQRYLEGSFKKINEELLCEGFKENALKNLILSCSKFSIDETSETISTNQN